MAVGADRRLRRAAEHRGGVNAAAVLGGFPLVAGPAGERDVPLADPGRGVEALLHLMTAVAVHAVGGLRVAAQQRLAMDTPFVSPDKAGRGTHAFADLGIVEVTRQAHPFLGDLVFDGFAIGADDGQRLGVAGQAGRGPRHPGDLGAAMRRVPVDADHGGVAGAARFGQPGRVEFRTGGGRRGDVVRPVAPGASLTTPTVAGRDLRQRRVEAVRPGDVVVAVEAVHRRDVCGVGDFARIQPGVAGGALEVPVDRLSEDRAVKVALETGGVALRQDRTGPCQEHRGHGGGHRQSPRGRRNGGQRPVRMTAPGNLQPEVHALPSARR